MSSLTWKDKKYLEKLFQMQGGYVLDFSDRTFDEFFRDRIGVDIFANEYRPASGTGSKANRMRCFWESASDELVAQSIRALIEYIQLRIRLGQSDPGQYPPELIKECESIAARLSGSATPRTEDQRLQSFLSEDFRDVDSVIGRLPPAAQPVLRQRLQEMSRILDTAPLAAVLLAGSTLEGILVEVARKNWSEFQGARAAPRRAGKVRPLNEWRLADLIAVAGELDYVSRDVQEFSSTVREFRNFIHPQQQLEAGFNPTADTAKICFQVLKAAIAQLLGKM